MSLVQLNLPTMSGFQNSDAIEISGFIRVQGCPCSFLSLSSHACTSELVSIVIECLLYPVLSFAHGLFCLLTKIRLNVCCVPLSKSRLFSLLFSFCVQVDSLQYSLYSAMFNVVHFLVALKTR